LVGEELRCVTSSGVGYSMENSPNGENPPMLQFFTESGEIIGLPPG
jgi:hypothetical protein